MIFFTADTHFDHKNIIRYCNRPFQSVKEMNESIIDNWNTTIGKNDFVYHLGDFAFADAQRQEQIARSLNGSIHLIRGNHDRQIPKCFQSVTYLNEIRVEDPDSPHGKQVIVLCHYAMRVWNKSHYGAWHLYGHSHGTLENDPNSLSIDVGVDTNNFKPYSYDDVKVAMFQKNFKPIDHHKGVHK